MHPWRRWGVIQLLGEALFLLLLVLALLLHFLSELLLTIVLHGASYMRPCLWMCTHVYIVFAGLCTSSPKPLAPGVPEVHPWGGRRSITQILLVITLGLQLVDKRLFRLLNLLGVLLHVVSELFKLIMLYGALVLQEVRHLEVHLQSGQGLPMNLLRTGSPPWGG